jgi:adenosylhomocysteine nucleosidase
MKIAIIVAMSKELNLLLPLIDNHVQETINGTLFHTGTLGGHDIVAMQCGIGKVNAAVGALTLIEHFSPDLVVNSGVAGGTGGGAGILDVVIADAVAYHDVWCGPGTVPGQAAECPARFDCSLPAEIISSIPNAKHGLIASGDIFVAHRHDVDRILELYPEAMAVDMESAAIAHVCHLKDVKFVCIRVISDTPGAADNISQYENFWEDAPRHTFEALTALLKQL